MKSWIRFSGSFIYSSIINFLMSLISIWLWVKFLSNVHGFWLCLLAVIGFVSILSWLAEKGVEYSSIPFNWLWDRSKKTRIASTIPAVLCAIWVMSAPFRVEINYSAGDIFLTIIWMVLNFFLWFNLIMLPWINLNMGVEYDKQR